MCEGELVGGFWEIECVLWDIQYLTHPRPLPRRGDIALASPFVVVEFCVCVENWWWVVLGCILGGSVFLELGIFVLGFGGFLKWGLVWGDGVGVRLVDFDVFEDVGEVVDVVAVEG